MNKEKILSEIKRRYFSPINLGSMAFSSIKRCYAYTVASNAAERQEELQEKFFCSIAISLVQLGILCAKCIVDENKRTSLLEYLNDDPSLEEMNVIDFCDLAYRDIPIDQLYSLIVLRYGEVFEMEHAEVVIALSTVKDLIKMTLED